MQVSESKKEDIHNLHAIRVWTTHDIEKNWQKETSFIRFTVIGRHAVSGFYKIFTQDYVTRDRIIAGKFRAVNNLEIKKD